MRHGFDIHLANSGMSFLYHPNRHMHSDPMDQGMKFDLVRVKAKDGVTTEAFYIHADSSKQGKCLLFCQGNGGNAADRIPLFKRLWEETGLALLVPSYRGYGNSEGIPHEYGISQDMTALMEWHSATHPDEKLLIMGESMGGGIAIDTVHKFPKKFSKMIIVNSFMSLHLLIPEVVPIVKPLLPLVHNKWASIDKMNKTMKHIKMLFVVGEKDRLINPKHGRALFEKAKSVGCEAELVSLPNAGHNDWEWDFIKK